MRCYTDDPDLQLGTELLKDAQRGNKMKLTHTKFQKKVTKLLENKGCWMFNVHGGRMQKVGVPDLLVIGVYWTGFLEFKIGKDKCSDIQRQVINEIKRRGFPVYVLRYNEKLDAIQIENHSGRFISLIIWDALYGWLRNHVKPLIAPYHGRRREGSG